MTDISRLAHGVLFPGIGRPTLPKWALPRIEAGLGGFILYGKDIVSAEQVRALTAAFRERNPRMHLATDEEGGDVTRLESAGGTSVPGNYALGALDDEELTWLAARQIGLSLAEAGIDWDLAPAVDTAVNPFSPNGIRTFGPDRELVTRHAAAWVRGLQSTGVSACAKHFPGHGLSGTDAHLGTPRVDLSRQELVDFYLDPFRGAIDAGVDSIMVSHVQLTSLDDVPATISPAVMTGLLRDELGFDGVVITDALEMHGISDVAPLPEAAVRAIAAGADALCLGSWAFNDDVDAAASAIVRAVEDGTLPLERLEQANERLARMGSRQLDVTAPDDSVGARLAREVISVHGDPVLRGDDVLVVRLEPVASPAAGRAEGGVEKLLVEAGKNVESVRLSADTYAGPLMVRAAISEFKVEYGDAADVLVLVRSPHRFDWQTPLLDSIRTAHPDAVILDMGVQHEDFSDLRAWVRSYGASRVCAQATADVLLGR